MTVGGIDIGTNTLLMVVAEVAEDGTLTVLEDLHEIPRLGAGVDATHMIAEDSTQRAVQVLRRYRSILHEYGDPPVVCVGTSALRDAHNQDDVLWELNDALGETVRVIDGVTEARLTYLGTVGATETPTVVCDIGGGSTELVFGSSGAMHDRVSLQIGCVRLSERWCTPGPVSDVSRAALSKDIRHALTHSAFPVPKDPAPLIAVAGTPTALATLDLGLTSFDALRVEGYMLTRNSVAQLRDRLLDLGPEGLATLAGVDPRRADILPAGAAILFEIMDFLHSPNVRVSTRGLRYGAALLAAGIST